MSKVELIHGDCMEEIAKMKDNFIDAIVTDPPYGLSFMGKKWDYDVPSVEIWQECLRILKPGGYVLSFAGTRTQHRMAVNIEDAGFEIRDMIAWVYGSGFPKSLNIGKAVDKLRKVSDKLAEFSSYIKNRREELKISQSEADKFICNGTTMYSFFEGRKDKPLYFPNNEHYKKMKELLKLDNSWDYIVLETNENIVGYEEGDFGFQKHGERWGGKKKIVELSMRASEWEGWGTALKPALEPITVARKPLEKGLTVAENCLKWGVGGINIDGCRVATDENLNGGMYSGEGLAKTIADHKWGFQKRDGQYKQPTGRFPANIIHDGSQEVLDLFPSPHGAGFKRGGGLSKEGNSMFCGNHEGNGARFGDSGSAARFFYCAKASKAERNRGCEGLEEKETKRYGDFEGTPEHAPKLGVKNTNNHPTVKPIALMEYLVKLVTREGQTVLDPFAGSGTTGIACKNLNREAILIEREAEYVDIAERRNS